MATNTRQTNIFAAEDWKKIYTTFSNADFQSYDFETLRKVMVDYVKTYYAEDFNDFIESSEYVALMDLIAFTAQSVAFRTDLNARENFLETAERRDSVLKLVKQLNYIPNRNRAASGFLKINSVNTTENLFDINGLNLSRTTINWNDANNASWVNQFTQIMNAAINKSQKIGKPYASKTINGIKTEQYNIAVPNTILPIFTFGALVGDVATNFEVVSANILTSDTINEYDPGTRGQFGIVYQNDSRGNASHNTGFFLFFKQGVLNSTDFSITEKVANRIFGIDVANINNSDIWMYEITNGTIGNEWTKVASTAGTNAIYNSTARGIRTLYSVNTRINDQIDLIFGDGSFSDIPLGNYRVYYRVSNGLTYRITPSDMANISVAIPYISANGRPETLTVNASLQYTVSNSSRRDLTSEIKQKAPQSYYTQNRMVNGEDYNTFPYTSYSDIVKVKSVNRFASGVSRGLDITDPTGKYTSTDLYARDGVFYKDSYQQSFDFTYNSRNDILKVINNQITPIIQDYPMRHFYFENYTPIDFATLQPTYWSRSTDDTTSSTGFFYFDYRHGYDYNPSTIYPIKSVVLYNGGLYRSLSTTVNNLPTNTNFWEIYTPGPEPIGVSGYQYLKFLQIGSLIKFTAPAGYYFDATNSLVSGMPILTSDRTVIWASIQSITGTGASTVLVAGRNIGAVTLSESIPSGAIVSQVYTSFATNIQNTTINTMVGYILNKTEFGLVYDYNKTTGVNDPWTIIPISSVNTGTANQMSTFDLATQYTTNDSSWLMYFTTDGLKYTVTYRQLDFVFGSSKQVSFIGISPRPVYDAATNTIVKDNIRLLTVNSGINSEVNLNIYKNVVENDGYTDSTRIHVTYPISNTSKLPTDPNIFSETTDGNGYIFYKSYTDHDNLLRLSLLATGAVNSVYNTYSDINYVRNSFPIGTVFYAVAEDSFYQIQSVNGIASIVNVTANYFAYTGRQDLIFEYQHNAENTRRIDPAATNLIDTYILTRSYDEAYRNYVLDNTGVVARPADLDSVQLNSSYSGLFNYKMISDEMILNAGVYKLLFGAKAISSLQATFQVVKNSSTTLSDTEVKSRVIDAVNTYFSLDNWDFGDTFYFSELAGYLHKQLSEYISSIVLIPVDINSYFGSLYEIRCQPNEIFLSAATVENVQIVQGVLSGINSAGIGQYYVSY